MTETQVLMLIFLNIPVIVSHTHQWLRQKLSSHQAVRGKDKFVPMSNTVHTSKQHTDKSLKEPGMGGCRQCTLCRIWSQCLCNVPLTDDTLSCMRRALFSLG